MIRLLFALLLAVPLTLFASSPCGRLTLVSGQPVMPLGDHVSQTVYYTPHVCGTVPAWNGGWTATPFGELSVSLAGTTAGEIRDVFYSSGVLQLGPAWSGNVRTDPVFMAQGIWTNSQGHTYLGTVYISADGITKFQTKPTTIPYGAANVLGVWNAYNRIRVRAVNRTLTAEWQYASPMVRYADNSDRFSITWVDGLGHSPTYCRYLTSVSGVTSIATAATVGCGLDQHGYPLSLGGGNLTQGAVNSWSIGMQVEGSNDSSGLLGVHRWYAMEQTTNVPIRFYGNDFAALSLELEM